MIVSALVLPATPLLLPGVTGRPVPEVERLRAACVAALRTVVAAVPDRLVVVGARRPGEPSGRPKLRDEGPAHGFRRGVDRRPGDPDLRPAPALAVAHSLFLDAGIDPARIEWDVIDAAAGPVECAAHGADLVTGADRVALVVLGDGSARRREGSPGPVDERAVRADETVENALLRGDLDELMALDPLIADELMIHGRPAWQVLAGALRTAAGQPAASPGRGGATVSYSDDPFGVWYTVAAFACE